MTFCYLGSKVAGTSPILLQPRLSDFFLRLADDPALLVEHERDPRRSLAAAGFTDEQITSLLDGGIEGVRQAVATDVEADPLRRHLVVAPRMTVHTPTPDDDEPPSPTPPPQPDPERS